MDKNRCVTYLPDIGLWCSFLVFLTSFQPSLSYPLLIGASLVLILVRILITEKPYLLRWIVPGLILMVLPLHSFLYDGALLLYERIVDVYHAASGYTFTYPTILAEESSWQVLLTVTFCYVAALALCVHKHTFDKQQYGRAFLLSFLIVLPTLFYSTPIVWWCFAPVAVYWLWLLGMHHEGMLRPKAKRRGQLRYVVRNVRKRKDKPEKQACQAPIRIRAHQLTLLFCCSFIILTIFLIVSPSHYQRSTASSDFRSRLLQRIDDFAYQLQYGSQKKGEVDLGRAGNRFYSGAVQFRVEQSDMQGTIYLKTISEGVYENSNWKPVSKERYEDADVDWSVVDQRYHNFCLRQQRDKKNMQIQLHDERSDQQYALVPYGLKSTSKPLTPTYDSYYKQAQTDMSYTFLPMPYNIREEGQREGQSDAYTRFVYQNYLQLPTEIEDLFNTVYPYNEQYHGNYDDEAQLSYATIETDIKRYLDERTTYSLRPGRTPKERDFVEYFLNTNKKGYCVHYATTATLLFRYMGIPARYAEGFSFHASELDHGAGDVLDYSAHAWVEIYDERYGWIPVEVTPGYNSDDTAKQEEADTPKVQPLDEQTQNELVQKEITQKEAAKQNPAPMEAKIQEETASKEIAWWKWILGGCSIPTGYYALYRLQGYRYRRRCVQANVKQGIANSYAWLSKLHKEEPDEEVYALIQEALYSPHEMQREAGQRVYAYARSTLRQDIKKKFFLHRLYLHLRFGV